jgi:hypothetical protein
MPSRIVHFTKIVKRCEVRSEVGFKLENATLTDLGHAKRIVIVSVAVINVDAATEIEMKENRV